MRAFWMIAASAAIAATAAFAAPPATSDELYSAGLSAFDKGQYPEAISLFQRGFELWKIPRPYDTDNASTKLLYILHPFFLPRRGST